MKGDIIVGFDELYQQYFKNIYHFLLGISKDSHLAEEITQEIFFKALRSLDCFDGRGYMVGYLGGIFGGNFKIQKSISL